MLTQSAVGSVLSKRQSLSRISPNRLDGTIDLLGTLMSFRGNAEIYGEGILSAMLSPFSTGFTLTTSSE
jgi:hypothetical protein